MQSWKKPNGTIILINENSEEYARELGWTPVSENEEEITPDTTEGQVKRRGRPKKKVD